MATKVVINTCYGGFGLSKRAIALYKNLSGKKEIGIERHDPILVQVVEQLGKKSWGECSELEVVSIQENKYRIVSHDGYESIETPESIEPTWTVLKQKSYTFGYDF